MKAKLQIRNFGPIINLDIEIRKFNILIGPHASGKSTIAKVLSVIHSFDYVLFEANRKNEMELFLLRPFLTYYKIEGYLKKNTYWFFEDELFSFKLDGNLIEIKHKKSLEDTTDQSESYYFPAERIALPMISESLFELTLAQSTLPPYFLQFGKDFTIARKNQKLFNIPILNAEYKHTEGRNIVTLHKNNQSLFLEETSSAIQANLPLLIILQYPVKKASLFVIEELELHGFPTLQKELLCYVIERMKHPKLNHAYVMLPTHSPYVLSVANNLLFADKVAKQNNESAKEVGKIINENSWISKNDFSAYYVENGKANSILNDQGLIDENKLDSISEDLAGEFDALMDLYKPAIA